MLGDTGDTFAFVLSCAWMRFHEDYARALKPLNLTPNRMLALAFVVHNPGCDQASMGRALGINRASTMSLIDKLEGDDLLQRDNGVDSRSNSVHPTKTGKDAYRKAMQIERRIEVAMLAGFSEQDIAVLRDRLTQMSRR